MTENRDKLFAVVDVRLSDLLSLCEEQKSKIEELTQQIKTYKESMLQTEQKIQALNTKYSDLLTAHVVSLEDGGTKNARKRLLKLVREIEKCIARLNG